MYMHSCYVMCLHHIHKPYTGNIIETEYHCASEQKLENSDKHDTDNHITWSNEVQTLNADWYVQ